jgi:transposase
MPRKRDRDAPQVVYRTARCGLRLTRLQRERVFGLLRSAGDVWCAVLEVNQWRRRRQDPPLAAYQELCRELTAAGPGTFGELDTTGARSVLRRYSDAWFATAKRRKGGDKTARYPRRRRGLVPTRWYAGTFAIDGRRLRIPVARGCPPLTVRLDRDIPYPREQVRSVTLGFADGRLYLDVTAEVPVAAYPPEQAPDPALVAGGDLGIIHPFAVAGPGGQGLLVSGRAIRAEHRQHLRDRKGRSRAAAQRAPKPGQRGSRRWRQHRRTERKAEARHDERGTSSTCPSCARRVPKPAGRNFSCPHCGHEGHRDLIAAASIAARAPGGGTIPATPQRAGISHRRAGAHLPGVHPARRDPRRRPPSRPAPRGHPAGTGPPPAPPLPAGPAAARGESLAVTARNTQANDTVSRTYELVHRYSSRSSRLNSLPPSVRGSWAMKSTDRGHL